MKIHIEADDKLSTTLYKKPTDCVVLLHFHYSHSLKCKQSTVFSQGLRYNLLIADDTTLQKELNSLTVSLLARKYSLEIITRNISKALLHSRDTLLWRTPTASSSRTVLPVVLPVLIRRKTILQVGTKPLAHHWKWSTTTQHLAHPPSQPTTKQNPLRTS